MSDFTAIGDVGRIPLVSLAAFAAASVCAGLPGWRAVCLAYGVAALCAALSAAASRLLPMSSTKDVSPFSCNAAYYAFPP